MSHLAQSDVELGLYDIPRGCRNVWRSWHSSSNHCEAEFMEMFLVNTGHSLYLLFRLVSWNLPCIGDLSRMAASKVPTQKQANIKCCFEVPPYFCMARSTAALCFYFNCNKDSWELFEPLCLQSAKGSKHHLWLWPDSSICLVQSHSSHSSTTPAVMIRKSSPANNRFRSPFLPKAADCNWCPLVWTENST